MGQKTLKRVPLNFDWPIGTVWKGYLNPHHRDCPHCESGYTPAGQALHRIAHLLMIAGECGVRGDIHPWLVEAGINSVSSDMTALSTGLAGRSPIGRLGHDSIDVWSASKKIIKAAGLPSRWGICAHCKGTAVDSRVAKAASRWRSKEPPRGSGWQLWETTSEGSPKSPVFASADELATWCEVNATTVGDGKATKEQWLRMFSTPDGCDVGCTHVVML